MPSLASFHAHSETDRVAREDLGIWPPDPAPIVRHGICRLTLLIGGMDYTLRRMPAPPGFDAVWLLRKRDPHGPLVIYAVAVNTGDPLPGCTCPDHEHNGSQCKHIMALRAQGLIASGGSVPVPAPSPIVAICESCGVEFDAVPGYPSLCGPCASTAFRSFGSIPATATVAPPAKLKPKARKRKAQSVVLPEGGNEICDDCGCEFDPMLSGHHSLCRSCAKGGA